MPSQQPPLHTRPPAQSLEQLPDVLQAWPDWQSDSVEQPQVPPARHAVPFWVVQSLHVPPEPQAVAS